MKSYFAITLLCIIVLAGYSCSKQHVMFVSKLPVRENMNLLPTSEKVVILYSDGGPYHTLTFVPGFGTVVRQTVDSTFLLIKKLKK